VRAPHSSVYTVFVASSSAKSLLLPKAVCAYAHLGAGNRDSNNLFAHAQPWPTCRTAVTIFNEASVLHGILAQDLLQQLRAVLLLAAGEPCWATCQASSTAAAAAGRGRSKRRCCWWGWRRHECLWRCGAGRRSRRAVSTVFVCLFPCICSLKGVGGVCLQ
jgi:hypothetical protein